MQTQTHTSTTKIVISFYHCSSSSCPRTDPRRARRGGRRRGEAGLERGRRRAQGMFQATAKLTNNGTGGEERRRGGTTTNSGGGRRAAPTALQGGGGGLVRREIERGKGGDAPRARNREVAHRRRRIDGENGARGRRQWWRGTARV